MSTPPARQGKRSTAWLVALVAIWLAPASLRAQAEDVAQHAPEAPHTAAPPEHTAPDAPPGEETPLAAPAEDLARAAEPAAAPGARPLSDGTPHASAQPAAPESPQTRQARELTARGRERFEAEDFRAALVEFSGAYELLSNDPRRAELLNNIAVCHERMFRYDLAVHYYERYLREGAPDAADRAEVEAVLRGLRGLLGTLRITANVSSEIWIDDRPYGVLGRELLVPAGPHVIELRARAHESARREVRVVPRAAQSLHFDLEPLPQYRGVHRAYFWSGVGVTSVALITGGALGLRALGAEKDARALSRQEVATIEDERKYDNLALAADLAFGTAALFAVGSTVLFFLTDWRKTEQRPERAAGHSMRVSFNPMIASGSLAASVRGEWR